MSNIDVTSNLPKASPELLLAHGDELVARATLACQSLRAAAKILRGQGTPKTADVVVEHAEKLASALRKVGVEVGKP